MCGAHGHAVAAIAKVHNSDHCVCLLSCLMLLCIANSDGNRNSAGDGEEFGVQCGFGSNVTLSVTGCEIKDDKVDEYSALTAAISQTGMPTCCVDLQRIYRVSINDLTASLSTELQGPPFLPPSLLVWRWCFGNTWPTDSIHRVSGFTTPRKVA